ncbi:unnamed protein product [Prunus armeniaca]
MSFCLRSLKQKHNKHALKQTSKLASSWRAMRVVILLAQVDLQAWLPWGRWTPITMALSMTRINRLRLTNQQVPYYMS